MVSLHATLAALALAGAGDTVLYDFYADWCGPCRAMTPTVEALAQQGHPVRKVNIDQDPQLAAKYGVQSIPCFVMVVDGREVDRVVGGTSFSRLQRMCKLADARRVPTGGSALAAAGSERRGPRADPVSFPAVKTGGDFAATGGDSPSSGRWQNSSAASPTQKNTCPVNTTDRLVAATVRLRIEDPRGHSCGTGTIIDARQGKALILTCGHIFRDSRGKGRIQVELFEVDGPNGVRPRAKVSGQLVSYNLQRDIGLIAVNVSGPISVARVASSQHQPRPGDPVVTVGCNHGALPTAQRSRVKTIDRYQGPPNLQVAGQSVEGRSGGGIFSADGRVIGVCNAAEPVDNETFCAALGAIRGELDRAGLAYVYQQSDRTPAVAPEAITPAAALVAVEPPSMPERMPQAEPLATDVGQPLNPTEQAAIDEILKRLREGAEVICVVRPRGNPDARSEVIMLDRVSGNFLQQLAAEVEASNPRQLTSFEVPERTASAK